MASSAPLILLVGMHRSGTSLLGSLLQALGVGLPGSLIAADQHNPEGYFEWAEVVELQERLLIDLDRWWPSAQGALALPGDWLHHPATGVARAQLKTLLAQEASRQQGPWAIKDPRTSRLLPLWLEITAELGIPVQLLLAVRDPAEVAGSLIQRDGPITGMDLGRAQQLWWRHNLEPLRVLPQGLPRSVVEFDRWFSQPEAQLQDLLQALPALQPSAAQQAAALALIRPQHRRSLAAAGQLPIHPRLRRLHRQLSRLAASPAARRRWPSAEPPRGLGQPRTAHLSSAQTRTANPSKDQPSAAEPETWGDWLHRWRAYPAPRYPGLAPLAAEVGISVCGASLLAWPTHLWLHKLPVQLAGPDGAIDPAAMGPAAVAWTDPHNLRLLPSQPARGGLERLALNLELPPPERAAHWLAHLSGQQAVLDPNPARVCLLRALGLPAYWLDPAAPPNGWLTHPLASDPALWAAQLGLPAPQRGSLVVLGPAGGPWDQAIAAQEALAGEQPDVPNQANLCYLPGWPELITASAPVAWAQAGWLMAAAQQASALLWAGAPPDPAAATLTPVRARCLPLPPAITPQELVQELAGAWPMALAEERPSPSSQELLVWRAEPPPPAPPQVAVVVSLFNYAERVEVALESVAAQRQGPLELIVVDDASTDQGAERVRQWMGHQLASARHPFASLRLLRHGRNAGLAAARNTAFAAASAPWCFVLDADNALFPDAVGACLALAAQGGDRLAVVHPLLAVEREAGRGDDQRTLVATAPWQVERLQQENTVDAMALVRRSAWQAVGGYTHIEGGWEDYDFWCKLIAAGYHGIQCPRVLGIYRSHAKSMSHTATNRRWRALSRTLQARHPWLQLPLAQ